MMGTLGVSLLGTIAGVMTDHFGPTVPILLGATGLLAGYLTLYWCYVNVVHNIPLLAVATALAGFGSTLAYSACIKTAAMNVPPAARGTAVSFPLAAFGLSAFVFSAMSTVAFQGNTAGFLAMLGIVTASLCVVNTPWVKFPNKSNTSVRRGSKNEEDVTVEPGSPLSRSESQATLSVPSYGTTRPSTNSHSARHQHSISTLVNPLSSPGSSSSPTHAAAPSWPDIDDETPLSPNPVDHVHHEEHHSFTAVEMLNMPQFYAQFAVLGLLAGVGQMYIYCVGYIVRALIVASSSTGSAPDSIQRLQSLQVALISLFSFAGRLLSGSISDILYTRLHLQRLWMVALSTFIMMCAHLSLIGTITNASHLWLVSSVIGIAYGLGFGVYPTIVCDTFGIAHLSKNWGFVAMSPVFSIYLFNLLFGTVYDRNSIKIGPAHDHLVHANATVCLKGTQCYAEAFQVTSLVSFLTLLLVCWMIYTRKHTPTNSKYQENAAPLLDNDDIRN